MAFLLFLVTEHRQLRAVARSHLGRFDQRGLQMFVLRVMVLEFYMIREFAFSTASFVVVAVSFGAIPCQRASQGFNPPRRLFLFARRSTKS